MRRVLYIAEITLSNEDYDRITGGEVEACDYVDSVLSDYGRDRGLVMKTGAYEVDHLMFDRVEKHALHLIEADELNDFETDLINNVSCPMGNCED